MMFRKHHRRPEILPGIPCHDLPYVDYRHSARDCDVALWEPRDFSGKLIAVATDGPFCHVSGLAWLHGRLWSAGYEERCNGFLSPLSAEVRRHPRKISVFRPTLHLDERQRQAILRHLVGDLTGDYAWKNIRLITLGHLLGLRWFTWIPAYREMIRKQSLQTKSAICSQHIVRSFRRGANLRFVNKHDAVVSPNDLARSPLLHYLGTLTWQWSSSHAVRPAA
ncbi:MAG: hypothetical protein HY290_33480 [Planctomycetia bacterium]|nr:hypothetical protein [Planctomycetia bacterium]